MNIYFMMTKYILIDNKHKAHTVYNNKINNKLIKKYFKILINRQLEKNNKCIQHNIFKIFNKLGIKKNKI
jgi:hypothetical protein